MSRLFPLFGRERSGHYRITSFDVLKLVNLFPIFSHQAAWVFKHPVRLAIPIFARVTSYRGENGKMVILPLYRRRKFPKIRYTTQDIKEMLHYLEIAKKMRIVDSQNQSEGQKVCSTDDLLLSH